MTTTRSLLEETIVMAPHEIGPKLRERAMAKWEQRLKERNDVVRVVNTYMSDDMPEVLRVTGNLCYKTFAEVDIFTVHEGMVLEMFIYDIVRDIGVFADLHHVKAMLPHLQLEMHGGYIHSDAKQMTLYGKVYKVGDSLQVVVRKMMACGDMIKTVVDVHSGI